MFLRLFHLDSEVSTATLLQKPEEVDFSHGEAREGKGFPLQLHDFSQNVIWCYSSCSGVHWLEVLLRIDDHIGRARRVQQSGLCSGVLPSFRVQIKVAAY